MIRHRAAGTPGRVRSIFWLSDGLFSCLFKGPTAHYPLESRTHFRTLFRIIFSDLFFDHNWCPKVPKREPQNNTKSHKSRKTPHQNAFLIEACKKTPSRRDHTSEFDDSYTLSAVFSEAQGSQKGVEMEPKWSLRAPQITKNQEKWALKKTSKNNTAKSGFVVAFSPQKGTTPFARKRLQNHNTSEVSSKWAPRPPK